MFDQRLKQRLKIDNIETFLVHLSYCQIVKNGAY